MNKWYESINEDDGTIISSRVRLARNLEKYFFQETLEHPMAEKMVSALCGMAGKLSEKEPVEYHAAKLESLSDVERAAMVEWHCISPMLASKEQDTGYILSADENICIMLNEEDHIRIQSLAGGANIIDAYRSADRIDNFFDSQVEYAFHDKYGYLTTCPTNIGTGLRASFMVFLPALTVTDKIDKLAEEVRRYGITIRGIYGEGTKGLGYLYQISNQKTLGCSEQEIISNLQQIVQQVIQQEKKLREEMLMSNYYDLEDKIYRSYGVLKYARALSANDAMVLLAQVKFGIDAGVIKWKNQDKRVNIPLLMMEIQPASMQKKSGRSIGTAERHRFRAEYLNGRMPDIA